MAREGAARCGNHGSIRHAPLQARLRDTEGYLGSAISEGASFVSLRVQQIVVWG